ncbi:hypothetical protein DN575_31135, partial [Burkholderia multivorans]|uniref:hypothetical protein n=1 Tax=Burkholderia multivorans TaxID=87883 RepID=UPI000DB6ED52
RIATTLRVHTPAHRRDESFRLLQQQADTMPALVDRLQTMMTTLDARRAYACSVRSKNACWLSS